MTVEEELRQAMAKAVARHPPDAAILAAVRDGGRTGHVAARLGKAMALRRPYILRRLRRLEDQGKVKRDPRYTFEHDIYWIPAEEPQSS